MSDLYDADILKWSEQQAALLRRAAAGGTVYGIDWPNIIDEIECVGRREFNFIESQLILALRNLLRAKAWPHLSITQSWLSEARYCRSQAKRWITPATLQRINLGGLYADAVAGIPTSYEGQPPLPLPPACPYTLAQLLSDERL